MNINNIFYFIKLIIAKVNHAEKFFFKKHKQFIENKIEIIKKIISKNKT